MKQRKARIDAKYMKLEQSQLKQIDDLMRTLQREQLTASARLRYLKESIAEIREKRLRDGSSFKVNVPDYSERVQLVMRQVALEVSGRPDGGTREILKKMYVLEERARRDARAEGPFSTEIENLHHRRLMGILNVAQNVHYYRIKAGDNCQDIIPKDAFSRKGSAKFFRAVKRN